MLNWWKTLTPKHQIKLITFILGLFVTSSGLIFAIHLYTTDINKNTNTLTNAISFYYPNLIGSHPVKISPIFNNAGEACIYYLAKYRNLYPYFINKPDANYPYLRYFAYDASWEGQNCEVNDQGKVQLIGLEKTAHRIEVKFDIDSDYIHIADGYGIYRSRLIFDNQGRFIERKILADEFKVEKDNTYINLNFKKENAQFNPIGNFFNFIRIIPKIDFIKMNQIEFKKYSDAIEKYVESRNKVHTRLSNEGCGVISIEPADPEIIKTKSERTKIMFLCFDSHVRVMERE